MTTPPLDLPALRDIANAATEGEWVEYNPCEGGSHITIAHKVAWRSVESATPFADDEVIPHWADARHIAAFDPPTVLALLDRVEAAEAKVAVVRELHTKEKHGVRWHCGECLQDDNTGSWEYVEWPCPTIRALDGVPNA